MKKAKHILKAVASGLIWGLGQVFNKQYFKALFFFLFFALMVGIELGTGNYIQGYDPYEEKLEGIDYGENLANNIYKAYQMDVLDRKMQAVPAFDEFYASHKSDGFTNDELIEYLASDILNGSKIKYYLLTDYIKAMDTVKENDRASDLYPEEDAEAISSLKKFNAFLTTYQDPNTLEEYYQKTVGTGTSQRNIYINVSNEEDVLEKEQIKDFYVLNRKNVIYYDTATISKYYIEVTSSDSNVYYENIVNYKEKTLKTDFDLSSHSALKKYVGNLYYNDTTVYGYYSPEVDGYKATTFTKFFCDEIKTSLYGIGSNYDQTDLGRFKLKVYFAMHPEVKADFEKRFDNFFYDRAGFFLEGFWGVVTIGTTDSANYYQIKLLDKAIFVEGGTPISTLIVRGHLSSYIMIRSLIALLLLCYFIVIMVWNIWDAYKTSVEIETTGIRQKDAEYFKKVYEGSFEYIVLLPAIFVITFISIMPIVFSFLVAFTSYSGQASDVGLFDWVGFKNFANIFTFGGDIPFAETFWSVFVWTVIWAVFSTVTVFFGGFFQALVINSEKVPLKKFWRTILILPWAIPAIITQMVFANIFNENGVVNAVLQQIGVYDTLIEWGWLGQKFSEITDPIQKMFYLGQDNIQWFTNPYNKWFVRIVLIVVNIWLGFPYYMALMTSTMTGLDKTLYEAAEIDGASKWQQLKHITFPLVMLSTAPLLVMCFSGNFNNFGMIYFVTQGGAHAGDIATAYAGDTDILISWIYSLTVNYKNYNMASVFSILIFFIVGSIAAWNYSRTKAFKED